MIIGECGTVVLSWMTEDHSTRCSPQYRLDHVSEHILTIDIQHGHQRLHPYKYQISINIIIGSGAIGVKDKFNFIKKIIIQL